MDTPCVCMVFEEKQPYEEVFTLPPHSTWNPCGIHIIPGGFHPFHMEYVLGEIPAILVIPFHLESILFHVDSMHIPWNDHLESIWNYDIDFTTIPLGFHMDSIQFGNPHGFHMDCNIF